MVKSLQSEWQYLQQVLLDSRDAFVPVEEAIAKAFLPALLQEQNELSENFQSQLALPVCQARIGIHYEATVNCTKVLAQSLLDGTGSFEVFNAQNIVSQNTCICMTVQFGSGLVATCFSLQG